MELDEGSLMSSKKPTEGEVVDKTIDRQTRPKQEQEQREVHKVSVKNLEAWFETKQVLMYAALHPEKVKNVITVATPGDFSADNTLGPRT